MSGRVLSPQEVIIKELIDLSFPNYGYNPSMLLYPEHHVIYDVSTLQFLRVRIHERAQLHWISCCSLSGEQHWYYMLVELDREYWDIGHVWPSVPYDQRRQLEPQNLPHVALVSTQTYKGLTEPSFYAFGDIIEKDLPIKTVKLISANGLILEDQVEQGLVLFIKDDVLEYPIWAELYDEANVCVNRYILFDIPGKRSISKTDI